MNSQIKFNIAYIKLCTKTEGPYKRCCIWFQGCNLNCPGCCNKELQELKPNHIVDIDFLVDIVKKAKDDFDIEGITLSGGEPSLQKDLKEFNKRIRNLGLGIIMFSGKERSILDDELVDTVDLLIDGPFVAENIDNNRILLGSTNKKLSCITERYNDKLDYFNSPLSIEEVVAEDYIFINGD